MKKRIIRLMLCASIYISASAQDCPPQNVGKTTEEYELLIEDYCEDGNGISTDPNNLQNPACADLKNDFEWRIKQDPSVVSVNPEFYIVYDEFGAPKSVRNPFNDPGNHEYSHLDDNHNSNYQPEDGWELLKVDFGALSNFNTGWTQLEQDRPGLNSQLGGAKLPYMILYNKYSGTFRFFGSLLGQMEGYETIRIELRIPESSPGSQATQNTYQDLKATNLLSIQGDAVQPLDQETDENVMVVFAKATNTASQFFWFDIPVAYDPCLCNIRSQLDITFTFVETANISLNGTIDGALKTETKDDGSGPTGVKVATTVIAAGVSTALAVKTGGAVINFQAYSDLVNVLAASPNISDENEAKLKKLAGYIECGGKFGKVLQDNYKDMLNKDSIKAAKAGIKVLEANTTFLTSLSNGCAKKDNGATTISGTVNISGTWTDEIIPGHTEILMALPGSNWTNFEMDREPYTSNGKTVPSYPAYNERLGTFALLETPKVSTYEYRLTNNNVVFRVQPEANSTLKYAFNPLLNIDEKETKIYVRYVVLNTDSHATNPITVTNEIGTNTFSNKNTVSLPLQKYAISSPFLPIDNYQDFSEGMQFITSEPIGDLTTPDSIFLQFKVLMVSKDEGIEGKNSAIYYLTFPLDYDHERYDIPNFATTNPLDYPNILQETKDDIISAFLTPGREIFSTDKKFDSDIIFQNDELFFYDGLVEISAKMSTIGGKKVTIYSTLGFELLPGAEIGSNIELIIGYPFVSNPIPPQTYQQVSTFCGDNNKYKAQEFAAAAIQQEKQEYERRAEAANKLVIQKNAQKLNLSLYPNPTDGVYTVDLDYALQNILVTVLDINGKIVYTQNFAGENARVTLDATQLEAGVYFIDVQDANGKIGRQRLVKY